ncbi:MAG: DNA translocase FtsK 4TM domain-containing protein, partial [Phycisphaerae bacterium]|nr:DNA translocase FtsK 4TM domain-containing protein [Phycisphaerae bacterium]
MSRTPQRQTAIRLCASPVLFALVALLWAALLTYSPADWPATAAWPQPADPHNWGGAVGAFVAHHLFYYLGAGAYALACFLTFGLFVFVRGAPLADPLLRLVGVAMMVTVFATAAALLPASHLHPVMGPGGVLGTVADVRRVVAEAQPDVVFHLAAASSPADSLHDPVGTLRDNVLGTASLLQALLGSGSRARVLLVTSSEIYGLPSDCPLTEDSAPAPRSAYGVSKLAVHELGRQVYRTDGLEIIEARPFNHIGPGQGLGFVVPDFAAQIAGIKLGQREPLLRVGDLSAARDFSDVRDIVRGYEALALGGQPGEVYHLCSGIGRPIQAVVDTLCALAQVA